MKRSRISQQQRLKVLTDPEATKQCLDFASSYLVEIWKDCSYAEKKWVKQERRDNGWIEWFEDYSEENLSEFWSNRLISLLGLRYN